MAAAIDGTNQINGPSSEPISGIKTMRRASRSLRVIMYLAAPSSARLLRANVVLSDRARNQSAMNSGRAIAPHSKCFAGTRSIKPERPPTAG